MTFRIYNPFRLIRDLQADLVDAYRDRQTAWSVTASYAKKANILDQAVDAHMEDRTLLIAEYNELFEQTNEAVREVLSLRELVLAQDRAAVQDAQNTVDIVAWVKAAEAALAEYGITVVDGPNGPAVQYEAPALAVPVYTQALPGIPG